MILVDTNILVHASDEFSPFHSSCARWIEDCQTSNEGWCSTWPIFYEFLRVVTHPQVLRRPWDTLSVLDFVESLLASPGFEILAATPEHVNFLRAAVEETPGALGNLMHDLHTVVLMREHGVRRIATRDRDFRRFRDIEIVDPARP